MEQLVYFVAEAYRYKESGSWEYSVKGMFTNLSDAKQMFHSRLGAISKASNSQAMAILYDSQGNVISSDYDVREQTNASS